MAHALLVGLLMLQRGLLVCLAIGSVTAGAGCSTYNVNRSALAPHATPQLHPGSRMDSVAELGFGASSVTHFKNPEVGNPRASVEIPGTQLHGDLRLRATDWLTFGLVYENGLDATAYKPKGNLQPDVDVGNVVGRGMSIGVSIPTSNPALTIGMVLDTMLWEVPWVEWRTCVENCGSTPGYTYQTKGRDTVTTIGVGFTPTYRTGNVTWFGGISMREHPTIEQKGTEHGGDFVADVTSGPPAWTLSAGAQLDFGPVKGSIVVYQTLTDDPVEYGPSMAAMVVVPLGKRRPQTPPGMAPPAAPALPPPSVPAPGTPPTSGHAL
jgi:hypothetical protein